MEWPEGEQRTATIKAALAAESRRRRDAIVALAQHESPIRVSVNALDRDPWVLNVVNATIDLKSGRPRKMVAYQAESDLVRLIQPHYERHVEEGRTLVQTTLANPGDIEVDGNNLRVNLEPLSSPHRTRALEALCKATQVTATCFPGTDLRLCFRVKPEPLQSLAFPGCSPGSEAIDAARPDILIGG